ncbi:MAG TPA: hypothetical protein VFU90_11090, partial [Candidatus Tumulicola sp.]|nr:hypothetical protein [Candidatus Tumulicola sp.]
STISRSSAAFSGGYVHPKPYGTNAAVGTPADSAPRCAAVSMPSASPAITGRPSRAASATANTAASGGGVRLPTIATLRAPGESADPEAFVERDRLQAEYSVAVVLVASELGGGALHTLEFACELARPRFALQPPGAAEGRPEWAGNLNALAGGAFPLPFDLTEAIRILNDRLDGT